MNKKNRKLLETMKGELMGVAMMLEEMKAELEEKAENVSIYFPSSERAEKLNDEASLLDEAYGNVDEAIRNMEGVLE